MKSLPRVLIVDDHPVVVLGLTLVIERSGKFDVCAEARNAVSAREATGRWQPDFVVLDLTLGGRDGIDLVRDLLALCPMAKILVFSALPELTYARRVFQAGGHGYVMKDDGAERVPKALAVIAQGERYASAAVRAAMFQEFAAGAQARPVDSPSTLSSRELQVLRLLAAGRSLGAIARELDLSVKTIGSHRERLKDKLHANDARALARIADEMVRAGRV